MNVFIVISSQLSIVAASAALGVSDIPWPGPAAAVRVGWLNGAPILNPSQIQLDKSALSLLYAGREDYTVRISRSGCGEEIVRSSFVRCS
jgi:polyribonucleotide nucleotidyltransferase